VIPPRLLVGLLQPLLALLLIAGMPPAEPDRMGHGARIRAIESPWKVFDPFRGQMGQWIVEAQAQPNRIDGDGGPDLVLLPSEPEIVLDLARLIETGRASHPTAPPSHRPCAAPPTGPPLA
jgi:hypothetical protein